MTDYEKIYFVQTMLNYDETAINSLVSVYLNIAEDTILRRMYPIEMPESATMPEKYDILQCELATRLFLRRGGEGEIQHTENGITRIYGTVNDEDLLKQVVPFVKVG